MEIGQFELCDVRLPYVTMSQRVLVSITIAIVSFILQYLVVFL